MSGKLRVTASTLQGKSTLLLVPMPTSENSLLQLCSSKLHIKAKKLYLANGLELNESNLNASLVADCKIIVSKGENYLPANQQGGQNNQTEEGKSGESGKESKTAETQPSPPAPAAPAVFRIISRNSTVSQTAVNQLQHVARQFPGVRYAIGMPDLHEGQNTPIGSAIASEGLIYPELIGTDIGCGMSLITTGLKSHKVSDKKLLRWVKKLRGLDDPWEGQVEDFLNAPFEWPPGRSVDTVPAEHFSSVGISLAQHADRLGTIGGGNHFAELQMVDQVLDEDIFSHLGMDQHSLCLLVHSGSRSLGENVLTHFQSSPESQKTPHQGIAVGTPEFSSYMESHRLACAFAKRNRAVIARRFLGALGIGEESSRQAAPIVRNQNQKPAQVGEDDEEDGEDDEEDEKEEEDDGEVSEPEADYSSASALPSVSRTSYRCVIDIWHNNVCQKEFVDSSGCSCSLWLHRKGAAPSDQGAIVIPGSRGAYSYLVQPTGNQQHSAFSLAHGAGRAWSRSKARSHLAARHPNPQKLKFTELNSHVICEDKDLLYEEAPQAYKPIEGIVGDLVDEGLIKIIARLRPLITYKTRAKIYGK